MTYTEKKERCKKCKYYEQSISPTCAFPCDMCLGATVTIIKPKKDYFEDRI